MSSQPGVVIVGASVAGLHAAEQLRRYEYRGTIEVIDAQSHLPYDRPPLSKGVLSGELGHEDIRLHDDAALSRLEIRLHLGVPATALDGRRVELADGRAFEGERVILATGLSPRALPGQPNGPAVRAVRTLDDALSLRERLACTSSLVIVGAGLIGGEVASVARKLGLRVTMLESLPAPMSRVLGQSAGELFAELFARNGVDLRTGVTVGGITADDSGAWLTLGDGTTIAADTAVVSIGSVLNTCWLGGLAGRDGVACDASGAVPGLHGVFAVGDIAAWPDPVTGDRYRKEHWTSARSQAAAVGAAICGQAPPRLLPEYAWTDQFSLRIQTLGRPELADASIELEPGGDGPAGTVVGYFAAGCLVGALLFGAPRRLSHYNRLIAAGAPLDQVVAGSQMG
jgi:NADPH-dependent 2,4-dienoyl-CoA reductase/sulfur reductase-like enzyme